MLYEVITHEEPAEHLAVQLECDELVQVGEVAHADDGDQHVAAGLGRLRYGGPATTR